MASTQGDTESTNNVNNSGGSGFVETIDGPENQGSASGIQEKAKTQKALSMAAFILYLCTTISYIFLSPRGQEQNGNRLKIARLVIMILWMIDSGVLFFCHVHYLVRYKREIASSFLISTLCLHYLVGTSGIGMTDGIGVIMVCILIAVLCPGVLGPMGMIGQDSAVA